MKIKNYFFPLIIFFTCNLKSNVTDNEQNNTSTPAQILDEIHKFHVKLMKKEKICGLVCTEVAPSLSLVEKEEVSSECSYHNTSSIIRIFYDQASKEHCFSVSPQKSSHSFFWTAFAALFLKPVPQKIEYFKCYTVQTTGQYGSKVWTTKLSHNDEILAKTSSDIVTA